MATDWAPIIQTGIGAGAALGGGFIGAWAQARYQRRAEQDRRREQEGAVLAEVRALLTDLAPDLLGLFATKRNTRDVFIPLNERWERIRIPLLTLAMVHEDKHVRDLARHLESSVSSTLSAAAVFIRDVVLSNDLHDSRERANQSYEQANTLLTRLEEAIQRA
jgi:hypothetical protein